MADKPFQYIQTLLEAGSFSRAAKRLNISQPSLSQFIMRLEKDVGATLVDRVAKPLRLTPAGECWIEAEKNVNKIRALSRVQIHDMGSGITGRLVVGTPKYFEGYFLVNALPPFMKEFPGVELVIEQGSGVDLEESVADGRLDLAIVPNPRNLPNITTEELYSEECLIALRADDPMCSQAVENRASSYPVLDFRLFDGKPFVTVKHDLRMRSVFDDLCAKAHVKPKVMLETGDLATCLALTDEKVGPTLVTNTLARLFAPKFPLRFFSIRPKIPDSDIRVVYRSNRYVSKAARALIDCMKKEGKELTTLNDAAETA